MPLKVIVTVTVTVTDFQAVIQELQEQVACS